VDSETTSLKAINGLREELSEVKERLARIETELSWLKWFFFTTTAALIGVLVRLITMGG